MLVPGAADNPSGRRNRHAERAGALGHALGKGHERRSHTLSDGDVDCVGGA